MHLFQRLILLAKHGVPFSGPAVVVVFGEVSEPGLEVVQWKRMGSKGEKSREEAREVFEIVSGPVIERSGGPASVRCVK